VRKEKPRRSGAKSNGITKTKRFIASHNHRSAAHRPKSIRVTKRSPATRGRGQVNWNV
jgi:hypothetical protein